MTQTIAQQPTGTVPSGTLVRSAAALLAAALLLGVAFVTGRVTAPEDVVGTVITAPIADEGPSPSFVCPPSRPPLC